MTIHEEILAWSESQPGWQRDALRRIYTSGALTDADITELWDLAAERVGGPQPTALDATHIGAGGGAGVVRITKLADLDGVNGFPTGRGIPFAPEGITVVYGDNGAGKSGYARVLKRACRARASERILGNAFDEAAARTPAKGNVAYLLDGAAKEHAWVDGQPSHDDLASVAVYDSECAAHYVREEGSPAFQPFGIRALNELARACTELDRRVQEELSRCRTDTSAFEGLKNDTPVGAFIKTLSAASDLAALRRLVTISDEDERRLGELSRILREGDPEPRAKALDRLAGRVQGIAIVIERANRFVTPAAVGKLRELLATALRTADAQEKARALIAGEHLPGTGDAAWRIMIDAAQSYSVNDAYSGKAFPNVDDGARCVLCQGTLTPPTRANLANYAAFRASEAARAATAAQSALDDARAKIAQASPDLPMDDPTRAEITEAGSDVAVRMDAWREAWLARREAMTATRSPEDCDKVPEWPAGAVTEADLQRFAQALGDRAKELRASADPETRKKLEKEQEELLSRNACARFLPAIEQCVAEMQKAAILKKLKGRCGVQLVSRRMTELSEKYITDELVLGLQQELKALGYTRAIKHHIPKRTSRGVVLCKVALTGTDAPPAAVLSEGEQRATALAFFLAELRLSDKRSTLVFDDPVTSLDHKYRRRIAERLANIARERQVIVFTHDAVFLSYLQRASDAAGVDIAGRRVEWDGAPGSAQDTLGWDVMKTNQRLDALRRSHAEIKKAWGEYPSEKNKADMATAYEQLRGTMERIVRDDLMNEVMQPFSPEIRVEQFGAVFGMDPQQWEAFIDVYDRACESFRGHDTPAEEQAELPTPDQLAADIGVLEEVYKAAKDRKKALEAVQKRRRDSRRKGPETILA